MAEQRYSDRNQQQQTSSETNCEGQQEDFGDVDDQEQSVDWQKESERQSQNVSRGSGQGRHKGDQVRNR